MTTPLSPPPAPVGAQTSAKGEGLTLGQKATAVGVIAVVGGVACTIAYQMGFMAATRLLAGASD